MRLPASHPNPPHLDPPPAESESWGHHFIWQPKLLAREAQDASAFFGQPVAEAATTICSPTFHLSLRTLYRTLFSHLFGSGATFTTMEQAYDSPGVRRQVRLAATPPRARVELVLDDKSGYSAAHAHLWTVLSCGAAGGPR